MNKFIIAYALLITGFLTIFGLTSYQVQAPKNEIVPQQVKALKMPNSIEFAGEQVPLDNFDVYERVDYELLRTTFYHARMFQYLKLANRYFPIIEPILAQNNVPQDFKYLAVAESGLRNAVSHAGAQGVWQFMPSSAKAFGLEINDEVDERYHIEKATEAACKHLLESKQRFGTWTLAAAAYNMGGTRLAKQMKEQQVDNYYELHLNDETSAYVAKIIALKEIMKNPEGYGFSIGDVEKYKPLDDFIYLQVDEPIHDLADWAKRNGTTFRMIKLYNPWLRADHLKYTAQKGYKIKVPK